MVELRRWLPRRAIVLAVASLPILLFVTFALGGEADTPFGEVLAVALTGWSIVVVLIVVGTSQGVLADAVEDGTAAWTVSMPVTRKAYVLAKFVGAAPAIALGAVIVPGLVAYPFLAASADATSDFGAGAVIDALRRDTSSYASLPSLGEYAIMLSLIALLAVYLLAMMLLFGSRLTSAAALLGLGLASAAVLDRLQRPRHRGRHARCRIRRRAPRPSRGTGGGTGGDRQRGLVGVRCRARRLVVRSEAPVTTHAIETRGLSKKYGDLVVLDGLDLEVQTGSVYGFLGPNGAGKSTTIKLMLDLIRPTAGSVTVLGHDAQHDGVLARSGVGYLPQQPHFHPYRTVRGVLSYMAHLSPRAPRGRVLHRRIDELLDQAGLAGKSRRRAGVLSGGERQRLGIAQALIGDPELLILDEPAALWRFF